MSNPEPLMRVHVSDLELPLYRTDQVAWDTEAIIRTVQTAPPEQTDFLRACDQTKILTNYWDLTRPLLAIFKLILDILRISRIKHARQVQ